MVAAARAQPAPEGRLEAPIPRHGYHPPSHVHELSLAELLASSPRSPGPGAQAALPGQAPPSMRLYCAGDLELVRRPCVAVVGTRKVSAEGGARARKLARGLAGAGVVVVSGLAAGVDTQALGAALEAGGSLIGVIGTPLDRVTPAQNGPLQETIHRAHLLVSQFSTGTQVYPSNFPARNRTMAALSDATVIVEASDTSGTLHQAAECRRIGRPLFLARSLVENTQVSWPKSFLSQPGVFVLTTLEDVLKVLTLP